MKFPLQIVLQHSEYPPIMKSVSRTKAAPYKETAFHRTPSESIANNYSPQASKLNIKQLNRRRSGSSEKKLPLRNNMPENQVVRSKTAGANEVGNGARRNKVKRPHTKAEDTDETPGKK